MDSYYRKYNVKEDDDIVINWTKYRIFSVLDILNSPMKNILESYIQGKIKGNNERNQQNNSEIVMTRENFEILKGSSTEGVEIGDYGENEAPNSNRVFDQDSESSKNDTSVIGIADQ